MMAVSEKEYNELKEYWDFQKERKNTIKKKYLKWQISFLVTSTMTLVCAYRRNENRHCGLKYLWKNTKSHQKLGTTRP